MLLFVIYLDYVNLSSLGRSAELILSKNYKSIQTAQKIRQHLEAKQNQALTSIFQDKKMGGQNQHQYIDLSSFAGNGCQKDTGQGIG